MKDLEKSPKLTEQSSLFDAEYATFAFFHQSLRKGVAHDPWRVGSGVEPSDISSKVTMSDV